MENDYNEKSSVQLNLSINNFLKINQLIKKNYENNQNENDCIQSFKILDIGCSLGLNSIHQVNSIISELRKYDSEKIVEVYHSDLPINNFSILFNEVNNNPITYKKQFKNVYSYGIGQSFIEQLVPNDTCDIIFSYNCLHWGDPNNEIFKRIKDKNLLAICKPSNYPPGFHEYLKEYLTKALLNRYNELKINGILSCNFATYHQNNSISQDMEYFYKKIKQVYREMANDDILSHDEVDSIFSQVVSYTDDQVQYAIDQCNQKGLILLNREKTVLDWKKDSQDPLKNIIDFMPVFTKRSINGDDARFNSIHNEFKNRLISKYEKDPESFDFKMTLDLFLFKKIN